MSDTLVSIQPRENSASAAFSFLRRFGDNSGCATKSHDHDFTNFSYDMSNQYVKQCEQCKEYKNIKDVTFYPAERETYLDGHVTISWNRYYCKDCIDSWGLAYEGYTYEEWSNTQPVKVERLHN